MIIALFMLAKCLIHKAKCIKTPPIFIDYYNEIQVYTKSLKLINSKCAKYLYRLIGNE